MTDAAQTTAATQSTPFAIHCDRMRIAGATLEPSDAGSPTTQCTAGRYTLQNPPANSTNVAARM